MKRKRSSSSIRLTGMAARMFMANLMVAQEGAKALDNVADGPLKEEIKNVLATTNNQPPQPQ